MTFNSVDHLKNLCKTYFVFFAQTRFIYVQKSASAKIGFKYWEVNNSGFLMI